MELRARNQFAALISRAEVAEIMATGTSMAKAAMVRGCSYQRISQQWNRFKREAADLMADDSTIEQAASALKCSITAVRYVWQMLEREMGE